ncbi:hypothetical protein ERO13_D11G251850v2 [Gossypium hirsutum]|uniref:Uncharacterized protein isoform X1 n=2 Tax=Gossypium TaxID=3633 RepID=A0ABM3AZ91_GOSHI|nr:uncharacterized protein LOC121223123 isoform X1 [Gossypium hirsutum]XP_040960093.1 uncharacterized protein LOC121223123 isoform X1 [Gossypium hirsutum]XP_040960094.1 uncharacterized protein LOC121223123 isoform X1 [Gossypium hirsutum]XP_040960095.1 uncharacterized protein LOC121223123 isoform X2 [Gossypium hirsutum]XP_040960096.1 uncharacterized protein LOC121223123 isoform X1 [Gossypium hirsutum]XP_040960097.1 uncharacterized protein LOC121223123 isoform X1 [Gossypium hirsutum]XP_04096009
MGFRNSYVGNLSLFYEIEEKLKQGHNVVLISNHHTEADPIIISLLLEKANPHIAENMLLGWYIAWLLLKMEHYFIGFPQILILDANSNIPFVRKTIVSISAGKYWAATATATCGMARKVWKNHILQLGYTELREKRSLKELILRVGHERM